MVRMIKGAIAHDGFLGMLHALLLMDDTVVLATSREMCERKLNVVVQYCNDFGMKINTKKTKFFVINGQERDTAPLMVDDIQICYSTQYLYLGAWFSDSGKMADIIALHEKSNQAVVNKFSIFCAANSQMPYRYKKLVFDAAVMSSLIYSSESWFTGNIKPIEQQYSQLVKCLLGVRKNTSITLCLFEAGIPPLSHVISKQRRSFLTSILNVNDNELPFMHIYKLCQESNTHAYKFTSKSLVYNNNLNTFNDLLNLIHVKSLNGTKFNTYKNELNLAMTLHPVYTINIFIPDSFRESFSRVRLMSHNLKVETGRWSRIPRELRVCQCNNSDIQSERHVLIECDLTQDIRLRYPMLNFRDINNLFGEKTHIYLLCKYTHEVLKYF